MMTNTFLSLTLISAALTFMALLKENTDVAMAAAASALVLALVSLIAGARSARKKAQDAGQLKAAQESSAELSRLNQELRQRLQVEEQGRAELNKQVLRTERFQETLQAELDASNARLKNAEAELQALRAQKASLPQQPTREATDTAVLQFLRSLQERGRLLDFAMADIHRMPDAQVGAAARVVHQGIKAVLQDYFDIQPISQESEGSLIAVPSDSAESLKFRLLSRENGASVGQQSRGRLLHRGWEARSIRLPQTIQVVGAGSSSAFASARIIAPAEIDMQENRT